MSKLVLILSVGLTMTLSHCLDAGVTIEQIHNAAKQRRKRYPQGVVTWTEERLIPAGGLAPKGLAERGYGDSKTAIPPETVSHTNRGEFSFKNEMLRYQSSEMVWSVARGEFTLVSLDTAFDGKVAKTLRRNPKTAGMRPDRGEISSTSQDVLKWAASLPIRVYFRPVTAMEHRDPLRISDLTATNRQEVIGGRNSSEFVDSQRKLRVWFSDDAACVVTRIERLAKGFPTETTDIEYDLETGFPRSWTVTRSHLDASLKERTLVTIQRVDVTTTLPDSHFQVSFPHNTFVRDKIKSETYISRSSGKQAPVDMSRIRSRRDYETIRDGWSPNVLSWILLACTISVVVLLAFWRWFPRSSYRVDSH